MKVGMGNGEERDKRNPELENVENRVHGSQCGVLSLLLEIHSQLRRLIRPLEAAEMNGL